jgi:hypothetical protein
MLNLPHINSKFITNTIFLAACNALIMFCKICVGEVKERAHWRI